jgi:biopolymer transport protein ExbD
MAGLTQPLEFKRFMVSAPKPGFDFVPFVDAMLIALFVALNISAFVIAPGTTIRLPESSAVEAPRDSPTAVLTVDRNQLYFFQGVKLSRLTLEEHLTAFVDEIKRGNGDNREITLLIKADASIPTSDLFRLLDMSRRVGFGRVHLAAEPGNPDSRIPWEEPLPGNNR